MSKPLFCWCEIADIEISLNLRALGAAANEVTRCPPSEQYRKGVDHHRFACAGFSGNYGKAWLEGNLDLFDDNEITDIDPVDHSDPPDQPQPSLECSTS